MLTGPAPGERPRRVRTTGEADVRDQLTRRARERAHALARERCPTIPRGAARRSPTRRVRLTSRRRAVPVRVTRGRDRRLARRDRRMACGWRAGLAADLAAARARGRERARARHRRRRASRRRSRPAADASRCCRAGSTRSRRRHTRARRARSRRAARWSPRSPSGGPACRGVFVRRNRLIAALAVGDRGGRGGRASGALSTAAAARRLGRPVLAVPGDVDRADQRAAAMRCCAPGPACARGAADVLAALERRGGEARDADAAADTSPRRHGRGRDPRSAAAPGRLAHGRGDRGARRPRAGETLAALLPLEWAALGGAACPGSAGRRRRRDELRARARGALVARAAAGVARAAVAGRARRGARAGRRWPGRSGCAGAWRAPISRSRFRSRRPPSARRFSPRTTASWAGCSCEYPRLGQLCARAGLAGVAAVRGLEHLEARARSGPRRDPLTGHLRNFELLGAWLGRMHPVAFVVRPLANPGVEPLDRARRAGGGAGPISSEHRCARGLCGAAPATAGWRCSPIRTRAGTACSCRSSGARPAPRPVRRASRSRPERRSSWGSSRVRQRRPRELDVEPPLEIEDPEAPDAA